MKSNQPTNQPTIVMSCWEHRFSWLSLSIRLNRQSHSAGPLDNTLCLHRAVVDRFYHLLFVVKESTEETRLWANLYFFSRVLHVLFVWFEWFERWEVGGRTAAVLWDVTSRICSIWLVKLFLHALCQRKPFFSYKSMGHRKRCFLSFQNMLFWVWY